MHVQLTALTLCPLQLESDPDDKAREEALAKEFAGVTDFLKRSLGERVEKVVVSNR
jgi:hypothetical protein